MRETLRWIGYLVLAALVTVSIVFAFFRIRGPSQKQRAALALMEKDYRPKEGRNAFPLMWYLEYDVPESEIATRFAAEVAFVHARLDADTMPVPYNAQANKLSETAGDKSRLCELRAGDCLAKVTADPGAMRAIVATYPVIRARDAAFEATDYDWNDFQPDVRAVIAAVPLVAQRVWLSAYALEYADGNRGAALTDTCSNLDAWRRIHRGANSLIGSMIAIASTDGAMRLFADMLATLPPGEPVPDACAHALRPIEAADVDRCAEMAAEFAMSQNAIDFELAASESPTRTAPTRFGFWVMFDKPQWKAWVAEQYAYYCEEPPTRALADVPRPPFSRGLTRQLECISSIGSCVTQDVAISAYDQYDARTLDYAAHLRLAAAVLWLHDAAGDAPLEQRFDARPVAMRSGTRASGYDAATATLFVDNLYTGREPRFALAVADGRAAASK
jgi:hypothetical protein